MFKKTINHYNSQTKDYTIATTAFIIAFLAIDFFPSFNSVDIIAPQFLYLAILNTIIGLFIYFKTDFIDKNIFQIFKKSTYFKLYLVFLLLCGISIFVARNFSLAIVGFIQILIVFATFLNLSILLYNRKKIIFFLAFIIGISAFIQSFQEFYMFLKMWNSDTFGTALSDLKGNTGNINIFAASLNMKIPFIILGILHYSNWKKWFLLIALFFACLVILLTSSRASFIGLTLEILVFIVLYLKIKKTTKINIVKVGTIIIPVVFAFIVSSIIFSANKGGGRSESVTTRVLEIQSGDESTHVRLIYWQNALKIMAKEPFFGIGIGNWKIESLQYERLETNDLILSVHPHNDFFEIAAETGIVNALIYISIFIIIVFINLKRVLNYKDETVVYIAIVTLMMILAYGVDASLNFPLYRATMQLSFALFMALTIINTPQIASQNGFFRKIVALFIIFIGLPTIYFSFCTLKAYQLESDRNNDLTKKPSQQTLKITNLLDRIPNFPNVATNSQPYIELLGIYYLKEKNYKQAQKYFDKSQKINPYFGRTEWYKFKIAKETGKNDSAYYYAKKAFDIRPRNESYFLTALYAAKLNKDTLSMIKLHNEFTKYIKKPNNWINTSSALEKSNYSNKNQILFINSGLIEFPADSLLLKRRLYFLKSQNKNSK